MLFNLARELRLCSVESERMQILHLLNLTEIGFNIRTMDAFYAKILICLLLVWQLIKADAVDRGK